jgi:hypothetical protein
MEFVLKKRCTTPGRYRLSYVGDPDTSNNTAILTVKVPGGDRRRLCRHTHIEPQACHEPQTGRSRQPVAGRREYEQFASGHERSPTTVASDSSTTDAPTDLAETALHNDSSNSGPILGILGSIAGIALLAGLWLYRCQR